LFPVVNLLSFIEIVFFQLLLLKTDIPKGSVATHLRCGGIFSDGIIKNVFLDLDSDISLKICQYLMKLRRMKIRRTKKCASFLGHPVQS